MTDVVAGGGGQNISESGTTRERDGIWRRQGMGKGYFPVEFPRRLGGRSGACRDQVCCSAVSGAEPRLM